MIALRLIIALHGSIYAYMKRAISDRYLTDIRKPKVGAITVSDY